MEKNKIFAISCEENPIAKGKYLGFICLLLGLVIIPVIFTISPGTFLFQVEGNAQSSIDTPTLRPLSGAEGPLYINEKNGLDGWSNCSYVTGNGSILNPYTLANLVFEGQEDEEAISILYSQNVYVLIENCTFNLINGDPWDYTFYIFSSGNLTVKNCTLFPGSSNGLKVYVCDSITLSNIIVNEGNIGIYLSSNTNIMLDHCQISNCLEYGIELRSTSVSKIFENQIVNNSGCGISLDSSNFNMIYANNLSKNGDDGLYIEDSQAIHLHHNLFLFNENDGIHIHEGKYIQIIENNFSANSRYGLSTQFESENYKGYIEVYHNNFANKGLLHVYDIDPSTNYDNATSGNFWDDFSLNYPSASPSGVVWNNSYSINASNSVQDGFPLVEDAIWSNKSLPLMVAIYVVEIFQVDSVVEIQWDTYLERFNNPVYEEYQIFVNGILITTVSSPEIQFNYTESGLYLVQIRGINSTTQSYISWAFLLQYDIEDETGSIDTTSSTTSTETNTSSTTSSGSEGEDENKNKIPGFSISSTLLICLFSGIFLTKKLIRSKKK